jgi:predicted nucleic acid-binding protein
MILACALPARADYLVSRDNDLPSIGEHSGIKIIAPEAFLAVLREVGQSS